MGQTKNCRVWWLTCKAVPQGSRILGAQEVRIGSIHLSTLQLLERSSATLVRSGIRRPIRISAKHKKTKLVLIEKSKLFGWHLCV